MMRALAAAMLLATTSPSHALPSTASAGTNALASIDHCIAQLDARLDVGYQRIAQRCPQLTRQLESSGWAPWLPAGWKDADNDLSAGSLAELRALVARELAAPAAQGPRLSVAALSDVLAQLTPPSHDRKSLWSRFRTWLRTVVERERSTDSAGWLDHMIQQRGRSQAAVELVTYGGLALVCLLAGVIVVNEIRAMRAAPRRVARHSLAMTAEGIPGGAPSLRDVEQAALSDKARLLLEMVVTRLTEARLLPPARAMTVRELTRSAKLPAPDDHRRLLELAQAAEQARYAPLVAADVVAAAVAQGQALLRQLELPT